MSKPKSCRSFWGTNHDFGKWEVVDEGELKSVRHNPPITIGFWIKQKRTCRRCGFVELDYQEKI